MEVSEYHKGMWHLKGTVQSTEILQNGLNKSKGPLKHCIKDKNQKVMNH